MAMEGIQDRTEIATRAAVILFMVGNLLAIGLEPDGRAALAPLLVADPDPRTTVMVALGVPLTLAATWLASRWLGKASAGAAPRKAP